MFKTNQQQLRILIQESNNTFPLHLCSLEDQKIVFNDLINKIQQHVSLNDYYLTMDSNRVLYDDQSLQSALSSVPDNQRVEIILCRRSSLDLLLPRLPLQKENDVPVIKPTVLRWTPSYYSGKRRNSQDDNVTNTVRKDSGISLDEPIVKKQRVMSADHPRKLPDPSTSPLLRHHSIDNGSLHPLELKRPCCSTAPSSPHTIPFSSPLPAIKLPALSSITSPSLQTILDPQLAPIHSSSVIPTMNEKRVRTTSSPSTSLYLCEHNIEAGKICGQTFRRSYDLSRHQTIHLENRPFCYCDKCGKKFTRMDALRRHERVQGHSSKHRTMTVTPPQQLARV